MTCSSKSTAKHQSLIQQKSNSFFKAVESNERDYFFGKAEKVLDCKTLKEWKAAYPQDLTFSDLPENCR